MPEEKQEKFSKKKALAEARNNAKQNPADVDTVQNFRKRARIKLPPTSVRKCREYNTRPKREGQISLTKKTTFYRGAFLEGYKNIAALGLDDSVIERIFGVPSQHFSNKGEREEDYDNAYREAMALLQNRLARQLVVKAIGYNYEEERIIYRRKKGGKNWRPYQKEVFKKHRAGDAQLFIFFMTNKFPDQWKISRELLTGKIEGYDREPGQRIRKAIEAIGRDVFEQNTNEPETKHPVSDGPARISDTGIEAGKE